MQIYTWDREGFRAAYKRSYYKVLSCGADHIVSCGCKERDITYSRRFFEDDQVFKIRAENIINHFNLTSGSSVFVVGCALGLLMEQLKDRGMNVWGCDNSEYIHAIKLRQNVKFPIHNISIIDDNFVDEIRNATGVMWFDLIITEDVLTSHDSYDTIFHNCNNILNPTVSKTQIVHLVDHNTGEPFIKKSLQEWRNINSDHTWFNAIGEL